MGDLSELEHDGRIDAWVTAADSYRWLGEQSNWPSQCWCGGGTPDSLAPNRQPSLTSNRRSTRSD